MVPYVASHPYIVSFLAIVPLAKVCIALCFFFATWKRLTVVELLAFATDELSMRLGQTLAGLLSATLVRLTAPLNAETCLMMTSFRVMRRCSSPFLRYTCTDGACCSSVELIVAVSGAHASRCFLFGTQCPLQIIALVKCELTVVQSSREHLFLRPGATV